MADQPERKNRWTSTLALTWPSFRDMIFSIAQRSLDQHASLYNSHLCRKPLLDLADCLADGLPEFRGQCRLASNCP